MTSRPADLEAQRPSDRMWPCVAGPQWSARPPGARTVMPWAWCPEVSGVLGRAVRVEPCVRPSGRLGRKKWWVGVERECGGERLEDHGLSPEGAGVEHGAAPELHLHTWIL